MEAVIIILVIYAVIFILIGVSLGRAANEVERDRAELDHSPAMQKSEMSKKEYGRWGRLTGLFRRNLIKRKKQQK